MHLSKRLGHNAAVIVQRLTAFLGLEGFVPDGFLLRVHEVSQPSFPQQRTISIENVRAERRIGKNVINRVVCNLKEVSGRSTPNKRCKRWIAQIMFRNLYVVSDRLGSIFKRKRDFLLHIERRNIKSSGQGRQKGTSSTFEVVSNTDAGSLAAFTGKGSENEPQHWFNRVRRFFYAGPHRRQRPQIALGVEVADAGNTSIAVAATPHLTVRTEEISGIPVRDLACVDLLDVLQLCSCRPMLATFRTAAILTLIVRHHRHAIDSGVFGFLA